MKSFKRIGLLVALVALVGMVPAFSAQAQGASCFGLADADCKILTTADSNIGKFTSFAQDFTFEVTAKGGTTNVDVKANGSGVFGLDMAAMSSAADQSAAFNSLKLSLDVTGSTTGTGSDQSGKTSLMIVNGVFYYNVDGKWQGVKLSDVLAQAGGMSGMTGGASANPAAAAFSDPAVLGALTSIPSIKGFITLTKTASSPDLDGQKQIEFVYTLDLPTLLNAPELTPVVKALVKASNPSAGDLTDDQIKQFAGIFTKVLGNTTIKITRWVGATDGLYHALGLNLAASIDPSAMGGQGTKTDVTVDLLVKLTKVGQPVTVTAPADAKMVPMGGSGASATMAATMSVPEMSATMAATMAATAAK